MEGRDRAINSHAFNAPPFGETEAQAAVYPRGSRDPQGSLGSSWGAVELSLGKQLCCSPQGLEA